MAIPLGVRALAGRLRRAQTSLRALGIEISFSREGGRGSSGYEENRSAAIEGVIEADPVADQCAR